MDAKEQLKGLLRITVALQDAMLESVSSATGNHANLGKYSGFKTFMRKYNLIAKVATPFLQNPAMLDTFNMDQIKSHYPWGHEKELFDNVYANVVMLRSLLEVTIGYAEDETQNLKDFIQANLRRAVSTEPKKEIEIQNILECLFIGRGMAKGIDYDRETGRVKTSGKESIPDFIFPNLKLCLEVKLSKSQDDLRRIVDEINADVRSYGTRYDRQLYVLYDLSSIQDEAEFKKDIESTHGVSVVIVKH